VGAIRADAVGTPAGSARQRRDLLQYVGRLLLAEAGGLLQPIDRLLLVLRHPDARAVADPEEIFRVRMVLLGRLPPPRGRRGPVLRDTVTHIVAQSDEILRVGNALRSGLSEPQCRLCGILLDAVLPVVAASEHILRLGVPSLGVPAELLEGAPLRGLSFPWGDDSPASNRGCD
jgi:hypothetical protein